MKSKIFRRLTALALAASFSIAAGCANENDGNGDDPFTSRKEAPLASKENIYKMREIDLPTIENVQALRAYDGNIVVIGSKTERVEIEAVPTEEGEDVPVADVPFKPLPMPAFRIAGDIAAETEISEEIIDEDSEESPEEGEDGESSEESEDSENIILNDVAPAVTEPPASEYLRPQTRDFVNYVAIVMDFEGNLISEALLDLSADSVSERGGWINCRGFDIDSDGNICTLVETSFYNQETFESTQTFEFMKFKFSGEIASRTLIDPSIGADEEYFYINGAASGDDGSLYINSNNAVYAIDEAGKELFSIKSDKNDSWISGFLRLYDGRLAVIEYSSEVVDDVYTSLTEIKAIDAASRSYGDIYPSKIGANNYGYDRGNEDYDLISHDEFGLYGYNLDSDKRTELMNWIKNDTNIDSMSCFSLTDEGIMCASADYTDYMNIKSKICVFEKIDPSDIPDRKVITMASATYVDYSTKQAIYDFNKNSDEYKIEFKSYNSEGDDYNAAITAFNNDIIAGNIPDIIMINQEMPVQSYVSKGLFADLYEFMDNDDSFNKEDYLENAFKTLEFEDKLHSIFPYFTIQSVIGKTSDVGAEKGWSMADMNALLASKPEGTEAFSDMIKSAFLTQTLSMCRDEFVDPDTGKCSFDSEEFISILEYANTFPDEYDYSQYDNDPDYWNNYEYRYRNGDVLLMTAYVYDFRSIRSWEKYNFGDEITFIGFPNGTGKSGSAYLPQAEFAISDKAKNPAGSWEFIKYLLTDVMDKTYSDADPLSVTSSYRPGGFPIKLSALDRMMEEAKNKQFYFDASGEKIEYEATMWIENTEVVMGDNTDEDNAKVMDLINSVSYISRYDRSLEKIVTEEAAAYFAGQKTAGEAAGIIQNRASIYVSESR